MIRINLAPKKGGGPRTNTGLIELVFYILATAAVAVTMVMIQEDIGPMIADKQNALAKLKAELTHYAEIKPEINRLQEAQTRAERLKTIIEAVQRVTKNPVMTLDELSRIIPQKVWLTSFSEQNDQITMRGMAAGPEEVASFMMALQESDYFQSVYLASVNQLDDVVPELPNMRFVDFTITSKAMRLQGTSVAAP